MKDTQYVYRVTADAIEDEIVADRSPSNARLFVSLN